MIGSLFRVLFGFLIACLVAGVTQVTFALTPQGMLGDGPMTSAVEWILLTATHAAVFSAPFALVAAAIGEWLSARSALYYVVVGLIVAMVGFLAQYQGETTGDPTIANTYATLAYVTTGIMAGLTYWLLAGRRAGEDPAADGAEPTTLVAANPPPPRKPIEVAGAPKPAATPVAAAKPAAPPAPPAPAKPAAPAASAVPAKPATPAAPAAPAKAPSATPTVPLAPAAAKPAAAPAAPPAAAAKPAPAAGSVPATPPPGTKS